MEAADVLKAICDNRSLELFRIVALAKQDTDTLISKTKLTRKQYYSRVSSLMNAGLIEKKWKTYYECIWQSNLLHHSVNNRKCSQLLLETQGN
jgi:predicted transcriptional regulator